MREPLRTRLSSANGMKRKSGALAVVHGKQNGKPAAQAWQLYEARKHAWSAAHPEASPAEYAQAMLHIARDCGL